MHINILSDISWLFIALWLVSPQKLAAHDKMKCTITLCNVMDFSEFEHHWKNNPIKYMT